jgi:UDP-N-acetylglucosamine 2-epimerase (non-hydrolysing)
MIDSLRTHLDRALSLTPWKQYGLKPDDYGLVTLHRPANVDNHATMKELAGALENIGHSIPLLFPIHPRTLSRSGGIWDSVQNIRILEPLGYLEFLGLMAHARVVITDSGGVQEETTALGIPCVTVRNNTERPITVHEGTNRLVPAEANAIIEAVIGVQRQSTHHVPELWDGLAAVRIVDVLAKWRCISTR